MKNKITPIVLGAISGFASYYLPKVLGVGEEWAAYVFFSLPGFIFGVCLYIFLSRRIWEKSVKILKLIGFALICGLAYYLAVITTIKTSDEYTNYTNFFIGGMVGGLVTLIAYNFLIIRVKGSQFLYAVVLSGILSVGWPLSEVIDKIIYGNNFGFDIAYKGFNEELAYICLFLVWQTGMFWALSYIFEKNNKTVN